MSSKQESADGPVHNVSIGSGPAAVAFTDIVQITSDMLRSPAQAGAPVTSNKQVLLLKAAESKSIHRQRSLARPCRTTIRASCSASLLIIQPSSACRRQATWCQADHPVGLDFTKQDPLTTEAHLTTEASFSVTWRLQRLVVGSSWHLFVEIAAST
jgi:hypothetical protein